MERDAKSFPKLNFRFKFYLAKVPGCNWIKFFRMSNKKVELLPHIEDFLQAHQDIQIHSIFHLHGTFYKTA